MVDALRRYRVSHSTHHLNDIRTICWFQRSVCLMPWLASLLIFMLADGPESEQGIPIPRAKAASEKTLIEHTADVVGTARDEAVELSSAAIHAPVDITKIILAPVRDSYQLIPG